MTSRPFRLEATADFRSITIGELFDRQAAAAPDRLYFAHHTRNQAYSYGEFKELVDAAAKGLLAIGIRKGDHVAIWAGNVTEWVVTQYATAKIGAVLVTVNPSYQSTELEYLLGQSRTRALVMSAGFRGTDYVAMLRKALPMIDAASPGSIESEDYPSFREAILIEGDRGAGFRSWANLLERGRAISDLELADAQAATEPGDVINIQYTSGTTGFPKGAMLSHANILGDADLVGGSQNLGPDDVICAPVPFYHCFGCVMGVLTSLTRGCALVTPHDHFDPAHTLDAVERFRATALYGVPTMFIAELGDPRFGAVDLSSLRTGIMAGAPCPIEVMRDVVTRMGASQMTIAYGQTEASPVITQTGADDTIERRVTTVGKALPGLEVRIVDPATGEECATGAQGELWARGFTIMAGYFDKPEETAAAIDPEGWLHTGDLATVDGEGYFKITGRLKDMVIRGGENIYPREVEEFLFTHPAIREVQCFGVPDPRFGEELAAWVRLKEGASLSQEELVAFCRGRVSHFKIPRYLRIVDEFPMTVTGKVQKYKMREVMCAELDLQELETA
jgi:fatty-acyl-CoA synthase